MVRFIRSTCPFVHGWRGLARLGAAWRGLARLGAAWRGLARLGAAWRGLARLGAAWRGLARLGAAWRGLVRRCATSFWAQASSNAWARKSCLRASIALISSGVQVVPLGSVKWVPLSVSTG